MSVGITVAVNGEFLAGSLLTHSTHSVSVAAQRVFMHTATAQPQGKLLSSSSGSNDFPLQIMANCLFSFLLYIHLNQLDRLGHYFTVSLFHLAAKPINLIQNLSATNLPEL